MRTIRKLLTACPLAVLPAAALYGQENVLVRDVLVRDQLPPGEAAQQAASPPEAEDIEVAVVANVNVDVAPPAEGQYWLGLQVVAAPELAKKQLGIEGGLAVGHVMEESPAAKADIRRHDILIKVNDIKIVELDDLVKAVESSAGKEMAMMIVRAGKEQSVKVTAAKRSAESKRIDFELVRPEIDQEIRRLEEALKKIKAKSGDGVLRLYVPRPGVVAPRAEVNKAWSAIINQKAVKDGFPSDLSVRVTKEGDQPAKIHVKQGDKEWNVSEDKLDELPEEIRPHVQRYVGKSLPLYRAPIVTMKGDRTIRVTPDGKVEGEIHVQPVIPVAPVVPAPPVAPVPPAAPAAPKPAGATQRVYSYRTEGALADNPQLEAILKEIRELRKELDELRKAKEE